MMNLPEDFIRETRQLMGEERFNRYLGAFEEEAPVSIRLNLHKGTGTLCAQESSAQSSCPLVQVSWCNEGFYLEGRPQFTFDPLFHAGCYYVQEAASMFVCHILRSLFTIHCPLSTVLDLCAAPGGKSTAMRSVLPEECVLVSNEPVPARAQILLENITKWGAPNCIVTNNYPRDFRKAKAKFDLILCDVPCSGEGMFRKDPATISEWSLQNVEKCWRLQREIVSDAWECLNPGGIMIYSTCTFNTKENEENVRWIMDTYDAEPIAIPTDPSWNITGSLLPGFDAPVYRFIPGITKGEGLFVCALRKGINNHNYSLLINNPSLKRLTPDLPQGDFPQVDLPYSEALKYLRGEALVLPADTPRGFVTVTYKGIALGPVKNIGNRANNLYPKPWRIKTTHLPSEPVEILSKIYSQKL
jgi:16S rRNA C967 or C1407 C5-methylase (RsmB/RsmF family)